MEYNARVTLLGTRGSMPCSGKEYLRYGGSTTCILVQLAGETLLLDGGSGLMHLPIAEMPTHVTMLLSHPHIDHLLGIPMCPLLFKKEVTLDLYAATFDGCNARQQVLSYIRPPLWPVSTDQLPAEIRFHDLPAHMNIGAVHIDTMPGVHPGGITLLRISGDGKTIVLATDCTFTDELLPTVTKFTKDCDLLLCDGQYSDEEWPSRKEFGHNTWTAAARMGQICGAKQVRIIHHAPGRYDDELDAAAAEISKLYPNCRFGHDEEMITL